MSDLPSPRELKKQARQAADDLSAIIPMYQRLHSMGLEPRRGETVHVSGGGESNTPATLAVDSAYAASRRNYARGVARDLRQAFRAIDRVLQSLERNVGPTAGYRQPDALHRLADVSMKEFEEARVKQAGRLSGGEE